MDQFLITGKGTWRIGCSVEPLRNNRETAAGRCENNLNTIKTGDALRDKRSVP